MALTKAHNRMIAGAMPSVVDFGAVGDGVTDDRAAFAAADANGEFLVPNGKYLIGSNLTISNSITFEQAGQIKTASGVVVDINGLIRCDQNASIHIGEGRLETDRLDLEVGPSGDYTTLQGCIDDLPKAIWQKIRIKLADSTTFNEDVQIDGFVSSNTQDPNAVGTETATVQIQSAGQSLATAATIGSLRFNSCSVPFQVSWVKFNSTSPFDNEDATVQFYDSRGIINSCDFSGVQGVNYPSAADKAISSYSGQARCGDNIFGTDVFKNGITVKSMGVIASDGGDTGHFTEHYIRTYSGWVNGQDFDAVTSDLEKIRAAYRDDRGFVTDSDTKTIHGPTSFAQPFATVIDSHFESKDWLEETLTSGGGVSVNTARGLKMDTTGGTGGSVKMEYTRDGIIGASNWENGVKSLFFVFDVVSASATATTYVVMGDTASKYIGFKFVNATAYAVYNDGTGETVAHTYTGSVGRASFGFTTDGSQIEFSEKTLLSPAAVASTDLPTGALPTSKLQIYLNDTTGNCSYAIGELRAMISAYRE